MRGSRQAGWPALLAVLFATRSVRAQEAGPQAGPRATPPERPEERDPGEADATEEVNPITWGTISPGKGFKVAKSDLGELNVSAYVMARYLNQLPGTQSFVDHLGREREIDTRQDIQFHRVMLTFSGWVYWPRLRYTITVWTVLSTQQVAIPGSIGYQFDDRFNFFVGINGLPGTRSLQGSHPLWLGTDRVMADEYFRPGFTSGAWITGEVLPTLNYTVMVGNNLSQLGISAAQLTRDLAWSGTVWWMPTTREFGPRGGFGDYEMHETPATRFGASYTYSREDRFNQLENPYPDNTQIRLSDSLLPFETGALAPDVTLQQADYHLLAVDAGFKYRGFHLQSEYYFRRLTDFDADGPLPLGVIRDHGFYVQAAQMVVPRLLEVYASTSQVFGEFNHSWEVLGGVNLFPFDTRLHRVNGQLVYVDRSPVSSLFGYYVGGQKGFTPSVSVSIFF